MKRLLYSLWFVLMTLPDLSTQGNLWDTTPNYAYVLNGETLGRLLAVYLICVWASILFAWLMGDPKNKGG